MVPAAFVDDTIEKLLEHLEAGDIIIDGGNSYYRDDVDRAERLRPRGIHYVDVGTSGGVFGLDRGFCLMIGGEDEVVSHLDPVFRSIAPGVDSAVRTPGRTGEPSTAENGYLHCGPNGAGHFVKMVHNGIEYGMMAAYAEGLNILHNADVGKQHRQADAETTPLRDAKYYQYDLDIPEVAEVWRRGSVVASWLLDLTAARALGEPRPLRLRRAGCPTAAKVAGPSMPRSTKVSPPTSSARRCSRGSRRATAPTSWTSCCRRCARSSAGTTRSSIRRSERPNESDRSIRRAGVLRDDGDLAHKKIFPALYAMVKKGALDVPVIGVASSKWTVDDLRQRAARQHHAVRRRCRRRGRLRELTSLRLH